MQQSLDLESENVGVYVRGSQESGDLLDERFGCELERALSQGREARLRKQQEARMRPGRGRRVR